MAKRGRKPGSPKGQPKPIKRPLDFEFAERFRLAMQQAGVGDSELADMSGCTRQSIHKYKNGSSKQIEAMALFSLADALKVSPRWLLKDEGPMRPQNAAQPAAQAIREMRAIMDAMPRPHNQRKGETGYVDRSNGDGRSQ